MTIKPSFNGDININQTNLASIDIGYVLYTLYTIEIDYIYYTRYIYNVDYILSHLNSIAITILVILMQRFSIS